MKTFDYLHQELCITLDRKISRYQLFLNIGEGLLPQETAAHLEDQVQEESFLGELRKEMGARKWRKLVSKIRRFGPHRPTPEEVFSRIWNGLTRND